LGRTTNLRRELKRRFYPLAKRRGFVIDLSGGPDSTDFRRMAQDGVDVFDIQWEKYGRPRFVVNFGKCPPHGVLHLGQVVPPEKLLSYMGPAVGRLQPGQSGSTTRSWFCQDPPLLQRALLRRPDRPATEVIDQLIELFTEMDVWFQTGEAGPHLRLGRSLGLSTPISPSTDL
jgi:hypothetical protein